MNREEYIEYLFNETTRAEDYAQIVAKEMNLDEIRALSFTGIVDAIRGFLTHLKGWDAYDFRDRLIFPEEPCSLEVYAIERSLRDMCWLLFRLSPSIAVFYAQSTQILRALLAIHLEDKGISASCMAYDSYYYKDFSVVNATEKDIENAVFDCMEFTCPDTGVIFYFSPFYDGNVYDLK